MFGIFSLPKILFTVVIIIAVWQGFKWLNRRGELQQRRAEKLGRENAEQAAAPDVEEMVQCPDCGAFVAKGGGHNCT